MKISPYPIYLEMQPNALLVQQNFIICQRWVLQHCSERCSADIQIDLWNRHLTNNDVWVFSHDIEELSYKLLFVICRLCIYIMSSVLFVHMNVLHEPFLP
jgi:hypothetical protein